MMNNSEKEALLTYIASQIAKTYRQEERARAEMANLRNERTYESGSAPWLERAERAETLSERINGARGERAYWERRMV